jgi:aspartyl-tRNA(Asn)/glutamyl-tRNA(Gln) amidotransferase subunit C
LALDIATVRRIARLARIRVPEAELAPLADELSRIMGWIEQLIAVDTSDVAPMTSVADMRLPQRPDAVTDGGSPEKVLANAPGREGNFFAVPKVVE